MKLTDLNPLDALVFAPHVLFVVALAYRFLVLN